MEERERFVRGTMAGALGTVAIGLVAFGAFRMWDWALGFGSGALVSLVSFRLIVAAVARFTDRPVPRGRGRRIWWVWSLVRLIGAAAVLFLVVSYLPVNLIGVALGLLATQLGMCCYLVVHSSRPQNSNLGTENRKP